MAEQMRLSRRGFLRRATGVTLGAVAFPYVVRPSALGKAGTVTKAFGKGIHILMDDRLQKTGFDG